MRINILTSRVAAGIALAAIVGLLSLYVFGPALFCRFGISNLNARKHDQAKYWLELATFLRPKDQVANYQLAIAWRRSGQVEAAKQHLQLALKSGLSDALYEREEQLLGLKAGQYPKSIESWRQLVQSAGADLPEVCEAFVLFRLARFETQQAQTLLAAWEEQYPSDARCQHLKGNIFVLLEKYKPAIACYQQAAELTTNNHAILLDLVKAQMQLLLFDNAIANIERILEDSSLNQDESQLLYARCLLKTGQLKRAREWVAQCSQEVQQSAAMLSVMGELHFQDGNLDDALKYLEEAKTKAPADLPSRYLLGRVLQGLGETERAKTEFVFVKEATKASVEIPRLTAQLSSAPDDIQLRFKLARLSWQYQSRSVGLRWFQELLKVAPNHQPTHKILAEHYQAAGDENRANFHRSQLQMPR